MNIFVIADTSCSTVTVYACESTSVNSPIYSTSAGHAAPTGYSVPVTSGIPVSSSTGSNGTAIATPVTPTSALYTGAAAMNGVSTFGMIVVAGVALVS